MNVLQYTFFQYALTGVILMSLIAAVVGSYVVARRMVFVTGGITHASFGGLGLGFFMGWNPVVTAAVMAVAAAVGVEWMSDWRGVRRDSAIGVVWTAGMALGTLLIFLSPGYAGDLTAFLFGNVLTITRADLIAAAVYLIVLFGLLFWRADRIILCAFDPDFAATQGLPARTINMVMTAVVAVGVVLSIRLVGIMLLLSLYTLPPMIAELHTRQLPRIIALAAAIGIVCSVAGLALSAWLSVPASAIIVLLLVVLYTIDRLLTRNK